MVCNTEVITWLLGASRVLITTVHREKRKTLTLRHPPPQANFEADFLANGE